EGFTVNTYMHGLGENMTFKHIYVKHVNDCMYRNLRS
ncbi:MAG TPA: sirohydrochlorin cobaltochelatase, partial [Clostridiaceae bacterium]|nr:sirohydrochlorin cobaltochelatase [Clostridiaceae bacterium]